MAWNGRLFSAVAVGGDGCGGGMYSGSDGGGSFTLKSHFLSTFYNPLFYKR
jgi:hypothetical protein